MSSIQLQDKLMRVFSSKNTVGKYVIVAVVLLFLLLVFKNLVILAVLLILTVIVAFLAGVYNLRGYGIELATLVTVLTGYTLGASYGIAMGLLSMTLHMVLSRSIGVYMVWVIPTYGFIGLLSSVLNGSPISQLGIIFTIGAHAVFLICTAMFSPGNIGRYIVYVLANIVINSILFINVAPILVNLIA